MLYKSQSKRTESPELNRHKQSEARAKEPQQRSATLTDSPPARRETDSPISVPGGLSQETPQAPSLDAFALQVLTEPLPLVWIVPPPPPPPPIRTHTPFPNRSILLLPFSTYCPWTSIWWYPTKFPHKQLATPNIAKRDWRDRKHVLCQKTPLSDITWGN